MHDLSSTKPLLCREFVGRKHELRELSESFQRAASGQPQLVLLAGEAGLGKTKLCRVFMHMSQVQRALVLYGQAIPQDQALPFGLFLDAFRRYFITTNRALPSSQHSLSTSLAFLLRLLPELTPLFPDITPPVETEGPFTQGQQAVFHGMLSVLQGLAYSSQRPLLLILEDLHWADETSLDLLAFLAHRLDVNVASLHPDQSTSLLIVGTYRSEALPDTPALGRLLSQLHTQRQAHEVRLAPLPFPEYQHCMSSTLEQSVPEEFARFLFGWDEGNPFFMEELLSAMASSGQLQLRQQTWHISPGIQPNLPPSLTTAILERFVRLPATDQEVLSYAAVIGRVFDFPLLAALCGVDERDLVMVLHRAVNAQLISEVSSMQLPNQASNEPERYQFRHALTREAVYKQMLAPERRLRHRAVAETLQMLATDTPTPSGSAALATRLDEVARLLAEHYWLAGLPEKARPYALHEAERASQVFAFREERLYLNMAQASLPQDSPEQLHLLQRLSALSIAVHDFSGALDWLSLAKTGYQRTGQHRQVLQVLAHMLLANWFLASRSMPDMLAELETAAESAFADPESANRGVETLEVSSLIAQYWTVDCQRSRAARWIERSVALFEVLTDPRKIAAMQFSYLARSWGKAHEHATVAEEGMVEARHVLKVALQQNLPSVIMTAYTTLAMILMYCGRSDEAEQISEEGTDFELRSGTLRHSFLIGWQCFFSGERWEQGLELLHWDIQRMEQLNVLYMAVIERTVLAHLLLARNQLAEAQIHLQTAQPTLELSNEYVYLTPLWWGLAKLHTLQGNLLRAQEEYERILNRWKTTEDTLIILPILLDGIVFYADTGKLAQARQWLTELQVLVRETENPVGRAALLEAQGVMAAQQGALEQAIHALRQAVEAWGLLKRRYQQALASQCLAELLLRWSRKQSGNRTGTPVARQEAEMLLDRAEAVYERLQISTGLEAVRALRSSTHLEAQRKRRRTLETQNPSQGLTQREMQVLIHLARGRTNKEIAMALSIRVSTVERHVTHILTKLGCETRTQAATYALTQGWLTT